MIPQIVHCLSGGIDSVVMLYDHIAGGDKVHAILFDYKQRHIQELLFAKHHCRRLNVLWTTIEIPALRGSKLTDGTGTVVVPNRNAILLSLAVNVAVSAGAKIVTYACNKDDEAVFPDCRMAFVQTFNNMLTTSGIDVQIAAPYIDKPKWWIIGHGRNLGVDLSQTWSCYEGGPKPCGKCLACVKREEALNRESHGGK